MRNYNAAFGERKRAEIAEDREAGAVGFSGEYPESEPETRAGANLIRTLAPSLAVSVCSFEEGICYFSEEKKVKRAAERISGKTALPVFYLSECGSVGGIGYAASLKIPAFLLSQGNRALEKSELLPVFEKVNKALVTLPTLV